jgi:hypothetical protein
MDMFFGTWLDNGGYTYASWTLPHELYCSYFALQLAFIVSNINHRWIVYLSVFLFILVPIPLYNFASLDYPLFNNK